jgi:hypothetical protein
VFPNRWFGCGLRITPALKALHHKHCDQNNNRSEQKKKLNHGTSRCRRCWEMAYSQNTIIHGVSMTMVGQLSSKTGRGPFNRSGSYASREIAVKAWVARASAQPDSSSQRPEPAMAR